MQLSYLVLALAVAAVKATVIDLNKITDLGLANTNQYLRQHRFTSVRIPDGQFGDHISFSDSEILGLDSLKRTGNCSLEAIGTNTSFEFHYGFGMYQQSFKILNVSHNLMSASYRIRDNSVRLAFTIHNARRCYVTLEDLTYERLAKVDFYASRPEYDGLDVEEYFEKVITPFLNSKVDKAATEKAMQVICKHRHLDLSEQMPLIHKSIIENVML